MAPSASSTKPWRPPALLSQAEVPSGPFPLSSCYPQTPCEDAAPFPPTRGLEGALSLQLLPKGPVPECAEMAAPVPGSRLGTASQENRSDAVRHRGKQSAARRKERLGNQPLAMEEAGAAGRRAQRLGDTRHAGWGGSACPFHARPPGPPGAACHAAHEPPIQVGQSLRDARSPAPTQAPRRPGILPSELCASPRPTEGPALLSATDAALPSLAGGRQGAQGVGPFPRPARASACQASMGFLAPVP